MKNDTYVLATVAPLTTEDQADMIARIVAETKDDIRLKIVVIMKGGAKMLVFLPDAERQRIEGMEPKAVGADVLILDEAKARRWNVL